MHVESRVTVLAALADPARLRIVDLLGAGDASPGELGSRVGLSSNLLAHHLRVLQESDVVTRHRSHGDRRRTYLRLRSGALDGLLRPEPLAVCEVGRVVFVCTGNSARSQLAAARWSQVSAIPVTSGGTRPAPAIAPGALRAARRRGWLLPDDRPRPLEGLLQGSDLVVTVCDAAHEELLATCLEPGELAGMTHWSVPDPVVDGTDAAFDATVDELTERVDDLTARLTLGGPR